MFAPVYIIISSHLSDVQDTYGSMDKSQVDDRLNFCKWLLGKYKDTSEVINPEEEFEKFKEYMSNRRM